MLQFHEEGGGDLFVNPDNIVTVSAWGDRTVLSLTDGTRRVVTEQLDDALALLSGQLRAPATHTHFNVVDVDAAMRNLRQQQGLGFAG